MPINLFRPFIWVFREKQAMASRIWSTMAKKSWVYPENALTANLLHEYVNLFRLRPSPLLPFPKSE